MNNQQEGNHAGDDENLNQNRVGDERFVSRTLLDYAAPRATYVMGPIRLSRLMDEPPYYYTSTINIIQNNYYHRLEYEDPHDYIQSFLCLL
jgi:hypothetical protein